MKTIWDTFIGSAPGFVLLSAGFIFITTALIRRELDAFLVRLNGTYIRKEYKEVVEARFKQVEDHFDYLRDHPRGPKSAHGD